LRFSRTFAALIVLAVVAVSTVAGCWRERQTDEDSTRPVPAARPLSSAIDIEPAFETAKLPADPAIWIHPTDPSRSVSVGTVKVAKPAGAIVVHGLDGRIRQTIGGIDRPNNVDVEYGFQLGGQVVDLAVATERLERQLRIFRIDWSDGRLADLGGATILQIAGDECIARHQSVLHTQPWVRLIPMNGDDLAPAFEALRIEAGIQRVSAIGGRVTATHLIDAGLIQDITFEHFLITGHRESSSECRWPGVASRTFEFRDFVQSLSFVNSLVACFDTVVHHPDVRIAMER
jgi:hypothetical protein